MSILEVFVSLLGLGVLGSFWALLVSLLRKKKYRYIKHFTAVDEFGDAPALTPISLTGTIRALLVMIILKV